MVEPRIVLHTKYGPVGPRLQRGAPLPEYQPSYDLTPDGQQMAKADAEKLNRYINNHHEKRKPKK